MRVEVEATVAYAHVEALRRLCERLGVEILEERYGLDVVVRVAVPEQGHPAFVREVAELTAGSASLRNLD